MSQGRIKSFADELKHATTVHHDSIEETALLARLTAPDIALEEYQQVLVKMFGFYYPVEKLLLNTSYASQLSIDLEERLKYPRIALDLEQFSINTSKVVLCEMIPSIQSIENALGVLYVLEGATLGGQYIKRNLMKSFKEIQHFHFYDAYGADTGRMWKTFKTKLNEVGEASSSKEDIIHSAKQTFLFMQKWMLNGK